MALKFYDSPFHVNHNNDVANEMAKKIDLSIILEDAERDSERLNNRLRNQALSSFEEYQKKEVSDFLRSGKPRNIPKYHK